VGEGVTVTDTEPTIRPACVSNRSIQDYAERVGRHHSIYDDRGRADIDRLIEVLGGNVEYAKGDESLHVRKPGDFTIYIPHFTSSRRDRFTKAHELGHYFLHYLYPKSTGETNFSHGGVDRAETEASLFASALLMPADEFRAAYTEVDGDAWKLAVRFDVSPRAAGVRAQALQLS